MYFILYYIFESCFNWKNQITTTKKEENKINKERNKKKKKK